MLKIKNSFFPKTLTTSLRKTNPYLNKQGYYLPYKYSDPSYKLKYTGIFLKKDVDIQKLIHKRFISNRNIIDNKYKKKNTSLSPKEVIINTYFPLKNNNNLFQYYLTKKDRKVFEDNPFISKYGSFNFGIKSNNHKKILMNFSEQKIKLNTLNPFNHHNHKKVKTLEIGINTINIDSSSTRNKLNKIYKKRNPFLLKIYNSANYQTNSSDFDDRLINSLSKNSCI